MAEPTFGVRVRATLTATAIVAITLIIALLVIGLVTRARLTATAEDRAASRADAVAALVEAGVARDPLPGRNPDLLAQVISDGIVVAADAGASGLSPFSAVQPSPGETILAHVEAPAGIIDDDGLPERGPWVLAIVGTSDGTTVIAGTPLDEAAEVFGAAAGIVGLGVVALLVVVAAATWRLTGRALQPVDRMRAEADQISEGALDRRLAVPNTGDEIARLAITLNDMLQRLDEAASARRRFVADASHELRSPVAAMRAMLEVTGDGPADEDLLGALGNEVDRLDRLVADLLVLARGETAATRPTAEVDVDQLLGEEARAMRRRSAREVDTSEVSAARILGDPDAMARLVRNLADNALRHAKTGVWLSSRTEGSLVVIGVDDDGDGVALDDRERVFERFVRLDAARDRASGGSGLGLAVVRAIAAAHGGEAQFVAPRRGGASIEVRLPAAPD